LVRVQYQRLVWNVRTGRLTDGHKNQRYTAPSVTSLGTVGHVTVITLLSGVVCQRGLGLAMINLYVPNLKSAASLF